MASPQAEPSIDNRRRRRRRPKPRRVCFSFAAYAKSIIDQLRECNVPVEAGLTDDEFAAVESALNFKFPPDIRSILQEGLPLGPGFPNWRSSSSQQLEILTNLPILGISKEISRNKFWVESWGNMPPDADEAVGLAREFLKKAPVLIPIYRRCYIPSAPELAGNPVFYVRGSEVRLASFDVSGFFQNVDVQSKEGVKRGVSISLWNLMNAPAWAATEARRIEFWTEMAEREGTGGEGRWWSSGVLRSTMEEACGKLREGGWKEEEVREMTGGVGGKVRKAVRDRESVAWQVRILSMRMLRAGWSREDVVDSLGCQIEVAAAAAALPPPDHHHHHHHHHHHCGDEWLYYNIP